jgi:hypothetical protein
MAQIVDREIRNTGPLEGSPPSLLYTANWLVGIARTGKEKWAFLSLFVFPFAKKLAGLPSQRNGLCRVTRLKFAGKVNNFEDSLFFFHAQHALCWALAPFIEMPDTSSGALGDVLPSDRELEHALKIFHLPVDGCSFKLIHQNLDPFLRYNPI